MIVFEDADLEVAMEGAMLAKMRNLGEACTAANRIYVHEAVAEACTKKLTAAMGALKMGDGTQEGIDVGPLVNADTRDKVAMTACWDLWKVNTFQHVGGAGGCLVDL